LLIRGLTARGRSYHHTIERPVVTTIDFTQGAWDNAN